MYKTILSVLTLLLFHSFNVFAQFEDCYAEEKWAIGANNTGPNTLTPGVVFNNAAQTMTLTADGDFMGVSGFNNPAGIPFNCSVNDGIVKACVSIPNDGTVSFNWSYTMQLYFEAPGNEPFGYCINADNFVSVISANQYSDQSGSENIAVESGDEFCLVLASYFSEEFQAVTVVSNFSGPECTTEEPEGFGLNAKVLLEGAYDDNGGMITGMTALIPLEQPYNAAPYNYMGTESLTTVPTDMVDWVLVEMRTGTPSETTQATTVLETKAGLLLGSGDIVGIDGTSPLTFDSLTLGDDYHICVRHRNHLDVLSATTVTASTTAMEYDFTTDENQAFGNTQLKLLETGSYGMFVGDYSQDGIIQTTDFDLWFLLPAQLSVYLATDGTLDGVVQVTDYDKWFLNKAKIGTPEVRFD